MIEEALKAVFTDEVDNVLIPCSDKASQESIRVMAYHMKKKIIPKFAQDSIGISKAASGEKLYVKVYKRGISELFMFNSLGEVVPLDLINSEPAEDITRLIEMMKQDGKTDEEIAEYLKA